MKKFSEVSEIFNRGKEKRQYLLIRYKDGYRWEGVACNRIVSSVFKDKITAKIFILKKIKKLQIRYPDRKYELK